MNKSTAQLIKRNFFRPPYMLESAEDLAKRLPLSLAHLLVLFLVFSSTDLSKDYPQTTISCAAAITVLAILRVALAKKVFKIFPWGSLAWFHMHTIITSLLGLGWGVLAAFTLEKYGMANYNFLLFLITVCGFTAGSLSMNASYLPLGLAFNLFALVPPLFVMYYQSTKENVSLSILFTIYLAYMLSQIKIQNKLFLSFIEQKRTITADKDNLQNLMDALPSYVLYLDENLCYKSANKKALELNPRDKIIGKKFGDLTKNNKIIKVMDDFINSDLESITQALVLPTAVAGEDHWFVMALQKLKVTYPDHIATEYLAIFHDIHDMKKAEIELEHQRVQSTQSSKMASLGEMASGIAHEINNPLAIIDGHAQQLEMMVEDDNFDAELMLKSTTKIKQMVVRISKIVKSLRSFSQDSSKQDFAPVSIKACFDETLELCQARFKNHNVTLKIDSFSPELAVKARSTELSQVILNLLNNAHDAIEKNNAKWVQIKIEELPTTVRIRFIDSGTGIPESVQERIFMPFFTTKDIGKGTGLGLSISKRIIESHNGTLWIDNHSPNTCFVIDLPKAFLEQKKTA